MFLLFRWVSWRQSIFNMVFNCLVIIFYMQIHWFQSTFNKTCSKVFCLVEIGVGTVESQERISRKNCKNWDHIIFVAHFEGPILWTRKSIGFSKNSMEQSTDLQQVSHQLQGSNHKCRWRVKGIVFCNKLTCLCSISLSHRIHGTGIFTYI